MDNYDMWAQQERRTQRRLAERPVCSNCEEHIQDQKAYYINGEWICKECMERDFEKDVDDYCE